MADLTNLEPVRMTEHRVADLQRMMRGARVEMENAEEILRFAKAYEADTIGVTTPFGLIDITTQSLIENASLEFERKSLAHDELKASIDNICDSFGIE